MISILVLASLAHGRFLSSSRSVSWIDPAAEPAIASLPLKRTSEGWYAVQVTLGGSVANLLVDTGSSNLWARTSNNVSRNSAHKAVGNFSAQYGRGSVSGVVVEDSILLNGGSTKPQKCRIGQATEESDFWTKQRTIDGILGLGCSDDDSVVDALACVVPRTTGAMILLGPRPHRVFGLELTPEGGSLHLGGVPHDIKSNLISMPTAQSCGHWTVPLVSLSVQKSGDSTEAMQVSDAEAILDSGTNGIIGPTFSVIKLARELGASPSKAGEGYGGEVTFYEVPCDATMDLPSLSLVLGDKSGTTVNVALKGADLIAKADGDEDVCHLRVAGWDTQSWILGAAFLTHVQAISFDIDVGSVAIAPRLSA